MGDDPFKPVRRTVTLGLVGEDYAETVKGLKKGEKVLVRSRNLETDGDDEEDFADEEQ